MTVEIKGLVEVSLIDWPGKMATVVFLPGCNLRCRYCHARDLVLNAAAIEPISAERIFDFLSETEGWIDGVVISGGEPTLYDGLPDLAARIKSRGLAVKLDTNGTRPDVIERLIVDGLVDAVSMDVKAPFDTRYFDVAGTIFDLEEVKRSVRLLMESRIEYEFRTTVTPLLLSLSDITEIAQAIAGARLYTLQPFSPHVCLDDSMSSTPACPASYLKDAGRLVEGFVEKVSIRA